MNKITFASLKAAVRWGQLYLKIEQSFDGMVDGFSNFEKQDEFHKPTLKDLENFKVSKNRLRAEEDLIKLSNCSYYVEFKIIK